MIGYTKDIMNDLDIFDEPEGFKVSPYKGQIGFIEEKIDKLIGYTPPSTPPKTLKDVKREYAERMGLIDMAKLEAPPEVIQQIEKLERQLEQLRDAREQQHQIDNELKELEDKHANIKEDIQSKRIKLIRLESIKDDIDNFSWKLRNVVPEAIRRTSKWYTISQPRRIQIMKDIEKELIGG